MSSWSWKRLSSNLPSQAQLKTSTRLVSSPQLNACECAVFFCQSNSIAVVLSLGDVELGVLSHQFTSRFTPEKRCWNASTLSIFRSGNTIFFANAAAKTFWSRCIQIKAWERCKSNSTSACQRWDSSWNRTGWKTAGIEYDASVLCVLLRLLVDEIDRSAFVHRFD